MPERLLIVESVTKKGPAPGPAKDVYESRLWTARRRYAESSGLPWLILSARHGLLDPGEVIEPYELRLNDLSPADFAAVAERAVEQLAARQPLDGLTIEAHVREEYADAMQPAITDRGGRLEQPVRGLSVCGQRGWYRGEQPAEADACSLAAADA